MAVPVEAERIDGKTRASKHAAVEHRPPAPALAISSTVSPS